MKNLILIGILVFLGININGQRGYSSGSVSMNRANGVMSPDEVIIEEYLNYHTHKIDLPKNGKKIALSMDYSRVSEKSYIVQVGIASSQLLDYSEMPPINVSLVIDVSGSMQSDSRLEKVKKATLKFVKGLRPNDYLSIVTYNSEARVILESQKLSEINNLENILNNLVPSGSTNLYDGLILGYEEVKKNFKPTQTSSVVLLTDGIANTGITDTEKITERSYSYNKKGINISTIGVGNNLNHMLLQQIARRGKGANHFVGDAEEDIIKVFDEELESLLSPIGKEVYLEIELPNQLKVEKVFGYAPEYNKNTIKIPLNNINSGLTQVVLLKLSKVRKKKSPFIKAKLNYVSSLKNQKEEINNKITIETERTNISDKNEVVKNYYIGKMAEALKEMATNIKDENFNSGLKTLTASLEEVNKKFPYVKDKDIIRVKEILLKNKSKIEGVYLKDRNIEKLYIPK